MNQKLLVPILLIIITILDAARDAVMIIMFSNSIGTFSISSPFSWNPNQWIWHGLKWAALYIPCLYLIYIAKLKWKEIIFLALFAFIIWNLTYIIVLDPEPAAEIFQTGQ